MKGLIAISMVLALAAIAACSATGTTNGGDFRFDAAPPPAPPPPDAGPEEGGTTFTALYTDFFGSKWPEGPGCAGDGTCHGAPDQTGALASGGYVCPPAADGGAPSQAACYAGMNKAGLINTATPETSQLVTIIRHKKTDGTQGGIMPFKPTTYVFSDAAVKRIEAWMAAGAKND